MAVSAAKLVANRRNAQKSTGPRTEEGKKVSGFNALDHGCRAKSLILPDEDPRVLKKRQAAWSARFAPRDDAEAYYLRDAVVNSWLLDRARRAQTARLTTNILNHGVDRDVFIAMEVAELGRRLFTDRVGPLTFYPKTCTRIDIVRDPSTSYADKGYDPDPPAELLVRLQGTLAGCEWLLAEWEKLRTIVDAGQSWLSSDKLKAVRLLGKQPFDVIDDRDVAMVFLASFAVKPLNGKWYWEIAMELAERDMKSFRYKVAARELESLMPESADKAREALMAIIERTTRHLTLKAEVHRERARIEAELAPDLLAFDDSNEGEQLRRYELACGRSMSRSLDKMLRLVSRPLSVVPGNLADRNTTNEATAARSNATSELSAQPTTCTGQTATDDEPNGVTEDVTNEPTAEPITGNEPLTPEIAGGTSSDCLENGTSTAAATVRPADEQPQLNEQSQPLPTAYRLLPTHSQIERKSNERVRLAAVKAEAVRRSRVRKRKNAKCGGRPRKGAVGAKQRTKKEGLLVTSSR